MTLEDKIFEDILTKFEEAGIKPRLDDKAKRLVKAINDYSLACWDCDNLGRDC